VGLGLNPVKIKMMPSDTFAFVTFRCEEDRQVSAYTSLCSVFKNVTHRLHLQRLMDMNLRKGF